MLDATVQSSLITRKQTCMIHIQKNKNIILEFKILLSSHSGHFGNTSDFDAASTKGKILRPLTSINLNYVSELILAQIISYKHISIHTYKHIIETYDKNYEQRTTGVHSSTLITNDH
jgi:hypothetical protein